MSWKNIFRLSFGFVVFSLAAVSGYGDDAVPPPPAVLDDSSADEPAPIAVDVITVESNPAVASEQAGPAPAIDEDSVEVIHERRADGTVKNIREMVQDAEGNYIKHGLWQQLDEQGEVIAEGKYVNNQRHGTWRRTIDAKDAELFSDEPYSQFKGPFVSEATLNHGQLHGSWTIYDGENRKVSVIEFADGKRHGTAVWLHPNGKTMQSSSFVDAMIDGELNRYDDQGKIVASEVYQSGRKVESQVDFYENKQKRSETKFLHPQLVIATPDDWWNCKLATFGTHGKALQHGTWTTWHENGQKKEQGTFDFGKRVGKFMSWHPNGQKASEGIYEDGKQHGNWTWWHANGQKQTNGHYTNGRRTGDWAWWNEDGRLEERTSLLTPKQPEEQSARRSGSRNR